MSTTQQTNSRSYSATKKLMTHNPPPAHCTPDTQSLDISSAADETFANWSGWAQAPSEGLLHSNSLGPHPFELCRQLTPIPESPEAPHSSDSNQPSTSTTYPLPETSTFAQDLQKLTLHAHMQGNNNNTDCLVCGKPYDRVTDETAADYL